MNYKDHYTNLVKKAKDIRAKFNPCQFNNGFCVADKQGCCGSTEHKCEYLQNKNCVVDCLACSLWYCEKALQNIPKEYQSQIQDIWREARSKGFIVLCASKEDVFEGIEKFPRHNNATHICIDSPVGKNDLVLMKL